MHTRPGASRARALLSRSLPYLLMMAALLVESDAWALPSFAQQLGVGCAQCHTAAFGPALTQFGREFKLNGYTLGGQSSIPLAAMVNWNFTHTDTGVPAAPRRTSTTTTTSRSARWPASSPGAFQTTSAASRR